VARLRAAIEPEDTAQLPTEQVATPRSAAAPRPILGFDEPSRRRSHAGLVAAALLGLAIVAAARSWR
jgi:hypothetical protein